MQDLQGQNANARVSERGQTSTQNRSDSRADLDVAARKGEKLTTALYMVTDIMSDREPMKWKLREEGVALLSDMTLAAALSGSVRGSSIRDALSKIESIVGMLDIAQTTRMLSVMNATVLRREYIALRDRVAGALADGFAPEAVPLPQGMFDVAADPTRVSLAQLIAASAGTATPVERTAPITVRPTFVPPVVEDRGPLSRPATLADAIVLAGAAERLARDENASKVAPVAAPATPIIPPAAQPDPAHLERRRAILGLFKLEPELSIRQITGAIHGVSEKTVQRELVALADEGVLAKRGDKRWARYVLVQMPKA